MFNKKAQVLGYGLIAGLIIGLGLSYITELKSEREFNIIGDSSIVLLKISKDAEKALLYIDQSAKFSAYQAIYDLSEKGGCLETENYLGYSIWDFNKCNPDIEFAKKNFNNLFLQKLNNFLSKYEAIKIPIDNYNLDFENGNLLGIAKNPLKIPIGKKDNEKPESIGEYSIKPSFKVNLDYDFSEYKNLKNNIENLMKKCNDEKCIRNNFDAEGFEILETCESDEKETFFEFVDYFESCVNSEIPEKYFENIDVKAPGCVCRNKPEKGSFDIEKENNNAIINGTINGKEFSIKLENIDVKGDELKSIEDDLLLHKDKNTGELNVEKDITINPTCLLKTKTKSRFCIKSNNNKFFTYDEDDGKTTVRNVVYKFVLDFEGKKFEQEIRELSVLSKLLSDEEVVQDINQRGLAIDVQCTEQTNKVIDIVKELNNIFEDNAAPILFDQCTKNEEDRKKRIDTLNQLSSNTKNDPVLLILSSGENPTLSYFTDQGRQMTSFIRTTLSDIGFSIEELSNEKELLDGITPHALKITFKNSDLENPDKIKDYADSVALSAIEYIRAIKIIKKENDG